MANDPNWKGFRRNTGKLNNFLVQSTSLVNMDMAAVEKINADQAEEIDRHKQRAAEMYGVPYSEVTHEQRCRGKEMNFFEDYLGYPEGRFHDDTRK